MLPPIPWYNWGGTKNKKNGVTYAYESSAYWDKAKQQSRNIRTCIGKMGPTTGEIILNIKSANTEPSLPKQGPVHRWSANEVSLAQPIYFAIGEKLGSRKI
jgi:hypothetical protein